MNYLAAHETGRVRNGMRGAGDEVKARRRANATMRLWEAILMGALLASGALAPAAAVAQADDGETTSTDESGEYDPRAMRTEGLDDEAARSRFRIGQALFDEGRYLEAAHEWEQAYELSQRPSLLFNAYLAYREAGRLADAVRTLEAYLARGEGEGVDRLGRVLAAMQQTLREHEAARAEQEEREAALAAERAAAEERAATEAARAEAAHRRADESQDRTVGWVIAGAGGGAFLIGGVIASVFAVNARSELEDNCPDQRCIAGFDTEGTQSQAQDAALAADIMFGLTGAAVITGLIVAIVAPSAGRADEAEPTVEPSASCGPTGCQVGLRGSF